MVKKSFCILTKIFVFLVLLPTVRMLCTPPTPAERADGTLTEETVRPEAVQSLCLQRYELPVLQTEELCSCLDNGRPSQSR